MQEINLAIPHLMRDQQRSILRHLLVLSCSVPWTPPLHSLVVTSDVSDVEWGLQSDKGHQTYGGWNRRNEGHTHQPQGAVGGQRVVHSSPRDAGDGNAVQHGQCHGHAVPTETGHCPLICSPDTDGGDILFGVEEGSFSLSALHQGSGEQLDRHSLPVQENVSGVAPTSSSFPLSDAPVQSPVDRPLHVSSHGTTSLVPEVLSEDVTRRTECLHGGLEQLGVNLPASPYSGDYHRKGGSYLEVLQELGSADSALLGDATMVWRAEHTVPSSPPPGFRLLGQ